MVISFMLHWTGDIIHAACLEVVSKQVSRIRGKAGSGTSLCCSIKFVNTIELF